MTDSRIKILYLVTQSEWGGAQEYVFNLAFNLNKNQYTPLVLAGRETLSDQRESKGGNGALFNALKAQKLPYQELKWVKRAINPLFDLLAVFELIGIFKKEKPNVIHLNSSKIGFLGSLAGKIYQATANHELRIIYTAHGWVFNEPQPWLISKIYFWIEKISSAWKDVIITVCEADKQIALKNNFKTKIVTIHNAVDSQQLNFLDKQTAQTKLWQLTKDNNESLHKEAKIIFTIANLYPTKGINYLIEAAAILIPQHPNLVFMVAGEGQERIRLESLILKHKLTDNFFLLGSVLNAYQYLKAGDLFVLPSVKEGLPYAILQAKAGQVPIIATRVGGLPEILPQNCLIPLDNRTGGVLPPILADKIESFLAGRLPIPEYKIDSFREFLEKTITLYK
ncbi:MAG: glycosyltransferase [Patescibacteria group bacterium]|jgi:glycosyltransferase involved in cell wall biosynthesis